MILARQWGHSTSPLSITLAKGMLSYTLFALLDYISYFFFCKATFFQNGPKLWCRLGAPPPLETAVDVAGPGVVLFVVGVAQGIVIARNDLSNCGQSRALPDHDIFFDELETTTYKLTRSWFTFERRACRIQWRAFDNQDNLEQCPQFSVGLDS